MSNMALYKASPKKLCALVVGLLVISFFYLLSHFFIFNISPSMPLGIYKMSEANNFERNDIVAACLNKTTRQFGLARDYVLAGRKCDNSEPIIKNILAVPGDNVILSNDAIRVNNQTYLYNTFEKDSKGRSLPSIPRGAYLHTKGFWLIGTHDVRSWDSRYWGPINRSQLLYKLNPVLTFK